MHDCNDFKLMLWCSCGGGGDGGFLDHVNGNNEGTGLAKESVRGYVHKAGSDKEADEVLYESELAVPASFGEVGAVLVENEHHNEMYLQDIVLRGFSGGAVRFSCRSFVHSKFQNPEKRVFFTNKVYLMNYAIFYVHVRFTSRRSIMNASLCARAWGRSRTCHRRRRRG